jgi:UDP-N-acetylmuramoyl-L-alanyl-D-glutamate--2,6-diaminopimelate ligase
MDHLLYYFKKLIPESLFQKLQPMYHYFMAVAGAMLYNFPSRHIKVIVITGTKGKSSTTEIVNAVLEAAGKHTAVLSTIRFKIGDTSRPNKLKMTTPGRFFVQKFLRQAVNAKCEYAIVEMTSGAVLQYRHKFIDFDALLFLNISPEHIEQHGSFENYLAAKLELAKALNASPKKNKVLVVNGDDKESNKFISVAPTAEAKKFTLKQAEPYTLDHFGLYLSYRGRHMRSHLQGTFNISNILAALTYASTQNISLDAIQKGLESLTGIPGRVQYVKLAKEHPLAKKQNFNVVVDYAHTIDSLEKVYSVFKDMKKIGILGNTGGGRDTWKRPEMAKVADKECSYVILTNEDPYDEDPRKIINDMLPGLTSTPHEVIIDRREAINKALIVAKAWKHEDPRQEVVVVITGKGTDPYIMEANGKKTPWSDALVAREELEKVLAIE